MFRITSLFKYKSTLKHNLIIKQCKSVHYGLADAPKDPHLILYKFVEIRDSY